MKLRNTCYSNNYGLYNVISAELWKGDLEAFFVVDKYVDVDVDVVVGVVVDIHPTKASHTHFSLLPLGPGSSIVGAIPVLLLESTMLFTAV